MTPQQERQGDGLVQLVGGGALAVAATLGAMDGAPVLLTTVAFVIGSGLVAAAVRGPRA